MRKRNTFSYWKDFIGDFQTYFKGSLYLELLTNLGAKGAKRTVKMKTTNICKSFFKNILLYTNGRMSKFGQYKRMLYPRRFILVESVLLFFLSFLSFSDREQRLKLLKDPLCLNLVLVWYELDTVLIKFLFK